MTTAECTASLEHLNDLVKTGKKVHLVGMGGVGMSALASVLHARGLVVSGSDMKKGRFLAKLEMDGVNVAIGHRSENIRDADWAIYSSAISETNPEIIKLRSLGIPIYHRAQVLAYFMSQAISLAITGTHGKTTSTSMASFLLAQAGLHPTCLVGGEILNFGSNVVIGDPHLVVAEVDESDRSQLEFAPDFALITNLDSDHLDVYQNVQGLKESFRQFVEQVKKTGSVVYCYDDANVKEVVTSAKLGKTSISYGLSEEADFYAQNVTLNGFGSSYILHESKKRIGEVRLSIPGIHNVLNSIGVIALLRRFGLRYEQFLRYTEDFRGAGRRLQVKLKRDDILIVDDYAHHPTEVSASLSALREMGKKVTAVFQPHRFSRTAYLANEFSNAFQAADRVLLTDIYSAGEVNSNQVRTNLIFQAVKQSGHPDVQMINRSDIVNYLLSHRSNGEVIAFLGAGDIGEVADEFASRYQSACPA